MNTSAQTLFNLIDKKVDASTKEICNRIFSLYSELSWTHEQRENLQPHIQEEVEVLVLRILKLFDNVGSVLPDEVSGWRIMDIDTDNDIADDDVDYADMWREYLSNKQKKQ